MPFDRDKCVIRRFYCGEKKTIPNTDVYSRKGTRYECLKRGYGAASWVHHKKTLSVDSLQQIKYIGEYYEDKFNTARIKDIPNLLKIMNNLTKAKKKKKLEKLCRKRNGRIDHRTLNSTILFLYDNGVKNLPTCEIYKE